MHINMNIQCAFLDKTLVTVWERTYIGAILGVNTYMAFVRLARHTAEGLNVVQTLWHIQHAYTNAAWRR